MSPIESNSRLEAASPFWGDIVYDPRLCKATQSAAPWPKVLYTLEYWQAVERWLKDLRRGIWPRETGRVGRVLGLGSIK
jgi:hypothetical protein